MHANGGWFIGMRDRKNYLMLLLTHKCNNDQSSRQRIFDVLWVSKLHLETSEAKRQGSHTRFVRVSRAFPVRNNINILGSSSCFTCQILKYLQAIKLSFKLFPFNFLRFNLSKNSFITIKCVINICHKFEEYLFVLINKDFESQKRSFCFDRSRKEIQGFYADHEYREIALPFVNLVFFLLFFFYPVFSGKVNGLVVELGTCRAALGGRGLVFAWERIGFVLFAPAVSFFYGNLSFGVSYFHSKIFLFF